MINVKGTDFDGNWTDHAIRSNMHSRRVNMSSGSVASSSRDDQGHRKERRSRGLTSGFGGMTLELGPASAVSRKQVSPKSFPQIRTGSYSPACAPGTVLAFPCCDNFCLFPASTQASSWDTRFVPRGRFSYQLCSFAFAFFSRSYPSNPPKACISGNSWSEGGRSRRDRDFMLI